MTRYSHKIGQERMKYHNSVVQMRKADKNSLRRMMRQKWLTPSYIAMQGLTYFVREFRGYKTYEQCKARYLRLKERGYVGDC